MERNLFNVSYEDSYRNAEDTKYALEVAITEPRFSRAFPIIIAGDQQVIWHINAALTQPQQLGKEAGVETTEPERKKARTDTALVPDVKALQNLEKTSENIPALHLDVFNDLERIRTNPAFLEYAYNHGTMSNTRSTLHAPPLTFDHIFFR